MSTSFAVQEIVSSRFCAYCYTCKRWKSSIYPQYFLLIFRLFHELILDLTGITPEWSSDCCSKTWSLESQRHLTGF